MKDSRLLKPSRPAMSINSTFQQRCFDKYGPSGYVWATFTEVSETLHISILLQLEDNITKLYVCSHTGRNSNH